jgi:hypothetical protein
MKEGDADANFAYYALHKLRILPQDLMKMSVAERGVIYAMIEERVKNEKQEANKMKK